jgi:hypothetical protein
MDPHAHLTLHFLVFHNTWITATKQLTRLCGIPEDGAWLVRKWLEDKRLVDVTYVWSHEPVLARGPVYECGPDNLRGERRRVLLDSLTTQLRVDQGPARRMAVLSATPEGVECLRGPTPSTSRPFEGHRDLHVAQLAIAGHSALMSGLRLREAIPRIPLASPGGPLTGRLARERTPWTGVSPLIEPKPLVVSPPSSHLSPPRLLRSGPVCYSLGRDFGTDTFGRTYIVANGLSLPRPALAGRLRLSPYAPDLAIVKGAKIVHAIIYAANYRHEDLIKVHSACQDAAVTYELWK